MSNHKQIGSLMSTQVKTKCGTGCGGCQKEKPIDCQGNGCGRCCQSKCHSNEGAGEQALVLDLLEKSFLPFVYVTKGDLATIVYKANKETSAEEIHQNALAISNLERSGWLTVDFEEELDEFSYSDYMDLDASAFGIAAEEQGNDWLKRGTLAVTELCFQQVLSRR